MSIKEGLDRVGDDVDQYDQEADETNEKGIFGRSSCWCESSRYVGYSQNQSEKASR